MPQLKILHAATKSSHMPQLRPDANKENKSFLKSLRKRRGEKGWNIRTSDIDKLLKLRGFLMLFYFVCLKFSIKISILKIPWAYKVFGILENKNKILGSYSFIAQTLNEHPLYKTHCTRWHQEIDLWNLPFTPKELRMSVSIYVIDCLKWV